MRGLNGGALSVPALLVVASFTGCAARVDPDGDTDDTNDTNDTNESDETTTETTTSTTDAESSSTPIPETTSGSDTTTDAGDSTTGPVELPDCAAIGYVAECEDEDYCTWSTKVGCIVDCVQIEDQGQCESLAGCEWVDSCRFPGPI